MTMQQTVILWLSGTLATINSMKYEWQNGKEVSTLNSGHRKDQTTCKDDRSSIL